ncbi:hypothetical protein DL769_011218 [Monosporascus sp. CRB-8-3]|nr:hypothetical protein DL769_011218 [Monosporascus sp. CRB-8-3]
MDPQERATMERTVELIFGYGRLVCASKLVAFLGLNKFYVDASRNFNFQLINPTNPWESKNNHLFMQNKTWVEVTGR